MLTLFGESVTTEAIGSVTTEHAHEEAETVTLSPAAQGNVGLKLAKVVLRPFERTITVPAFNPSLVAGDRVLQTPVHDQAGSPPQHQHAPEAIQSPQRDRPDG